MHLRIPRTLRALPQLHLHRDLLRPGHPPGEHGIPAFDREKCIHCGAFLWNCTTPVNGGTNIDFRAVAGGLHSAEN